MRREVITSRENQLAKQARAVRDGRVRELIFVEGLRLCEEAVAAGLRITDVLYTERFAAEERGGRLLRALLEKSERAALVSEGVLESVSDTKTPQGVVALVERPRTGALELERRAVEALSPPSLLLVMHRTNNPANAGAILRTAEAAGATGVVTTAGSTDILSPKALRGAMGSGFRLPLWTDAAFDEALAFCSARGIRTVCADARARRSYTELDWTTPRAIILGPEAAGLSEQEAAAADEAVRIPMRAPVESLNVAVAAAIFLYEAARQRARGWRLETGG